MHPQLSKAIDEAVAKGTPPRYIAFELIDAGWPPPMVHQALDDWLLTHDISFEQRVKFDAWLHEYTKRGRASVLLLGLVSGLQTAVFLVQIVLIQIMIDSGIGVTPAPQPIEHLTHSTYLLYGIGSVLLGLFIVNQLLRAGYEALITRYSFKLDYELKAAYFKHVLYLPLTHQEYLSKGDYHYRQDVVNDNLSSTAITTTALRVDAAFRIIGIIGLLVFLRYELAIIAVGVVIFNWLIHKTIRPVIDQKAAETKKTENSTNAHFVEVIDNAETVQAFMLEEKMIHKLNKIWLSTYQAIFSQQIWQRISQSLNQIVVALACFGILFVGGSALFNHSLSLGSLAIAFALTAALLPPSRQFFDQFAVHSRKRKELERVYEILQDHAGIENIEPTAMQLEFRGKIEFNMVSYNTHGRLVLQDVNLKIKPGQKVAIIGADGTGRSTILKLLAGFAKPTAGSIFIDGQDVSTVPLKELRHNIAWIGESPQLFSKTIIENVLDGDITREIAVAEMLRATNAAHVPEFVHTLPLKYNSPVGPQGVRLTNGQKQRIAIARALANDAPIICMDEPAIIEQGDNSEHLLTDAIHTLINNRTVLMVTRRPSVLALMDEVYVIEGNQLRNVREYGGYQLYLHYLQAHEQL